MRVKSRSAVASGVLFAALSAVSFGVTTPLIAVYGARIPALVTASLLYAGAAILSAALRLTRARSGAPLTRAAAPRLLAIALFGAALAPTLLAWGLLIGMSTCPWSMSTPTVTTTATTVTLMTRR